VSRCWKVRKDSIRWRRGSGCGPLHHEQPKLDAVSGDAEASYGVTAGGDPNSALHATLNVPVIPDVFALRGVIYNDHRGGYIDNVPSTFHAPELGPGSVLYRPASNAVTGLCPNGLSSASGNCVPGGSAVANNFAVARSDQNPVDYTGARLSGLYKINDDWDVLIAQSYQNMEADGVSTQYPIGSDGQALERTRLRLSRRPTTRTSLRTQPGRSTARSGI